MEASVKVPTWSSHGSFSRTHRNSCAYYVISRYPFPILCNSDFFQDLSWAISTDTGCAGCRRVEERFNVKNTHTSKTTGKRGGGTGGVAQSVGEAMRYCTIVCGDGPRTAQFHAVGHEHVWKN